MITGEIDAIIKALFWGMILAFEYDCIRIFRRLVRHYHIWTMSVEDIVFWINVGFTMFSVTYIANDGIIRGFIVAGFIIGALVFRYSISTYYIKYVSKGIIFILRPLKKILKMIKMVLKGGFGKIRKSIVNVVAAKRKQNSD